MPPIQQSTEMTLHHVVESFWETIPPFWNRVKAHIRQVAMEQFDLSVEQFHILRNIRRGLDSVSDLAEVKNISRPAVSQAVDALVLKGLVTRTPDAQDRRHIRLALTEAGNELLDAIFGNVREWMMQLLAPLGEDGLLRLAEAMDSLRKIEAE